MRKLGLAVACLSAILFAGTALAQGENCKQCLANCDDKPGEKGCFDPGTGNAGWSQCDDGCEVTSTCGLTGGTNCTSGPPEQDDAEDLEFKLAIVARLASPNQIVHLRLPSGDILGSVGTVALTGIPEGISPMAFLAARYEKCQRDRALRAVLASVPLGLVH